MVFFLNGVSAAASLIAAVQFLRFWRDTRDRLFLWFAAAFVMFATHWWAICLLQPAVEARHWFYLFRLTGFVLILLAIVDKNRPATR
jgi:hypothetical protein